MWYKCLSKHGRFFVRLWVFLVGFFGIDGTVLIHGMAGPESRLPKVWLLVLLVCCVLLTWQHGSPPGIQVGLNSMLAKLVNTHTDQAGRCVMTVMKVLRVTKLRCHPRLHILSKTCWCT
jgi:hypothetical protein